MGINLNFPKGVCKKLKNILGFAFGFNPFNDKNAFGGFWNITSLFIMLCRRFKKCPIPKDVQYLKKHRMEYFDEEKHSF